MNRKLQVFVSSTYSDLIQDRQSAVSAILKAGHIPAGMELFTAGDKSQMDTIKRWIEESDVYMLILGGRYGSIEETTGISYTELEYDYARELKKPMFAVVITDVELEARVKRLGSSVKENDNPKELKLFREKVLKFISSFFEDPRDIKLSVYESLSDFSSNKELKGWISGDQIINTQPLLDEISKLSNENQQLKITITALENKSSSSPVKIQNSIDFEEIEQIFKETLIKIPALIGKDRKEFEADLLYIINYYTNLIATGVTNIQDRVFENFLYYNICPKLLIHGLVANEKPTGANYRRYFLTKKGLEFFAYLSKSKKRETKSEAIPKETTETEIKSKVKAKPKRKPQKN